MAAERVAAQQDHIKRKHESPDSDAERGHSRRIGEPGRFPNIRGEKKYEHQRDVEQIAMDILENQRKRIFAAITFTWFAHGTRWRVRPECFVVRAAIVVARQPEKT